MILKRGILNLIFVSLFIFGCSASSFKSQSTHLELMGNPTTGYTWIFKEEDDSIIHVEQSVQYMGEKGLVGAPSRFYYTISSLKPGNTVLKFEYKRPWDSNSTMQVRCFEVNVSKSGKIIMNEKKIENKIKSYKSVSMVEGLKLYSENEGSILLDVRRPDEFLQGHIPGAVLLTMETFTEKDAAKVIPNKTSKIFVYCRSGRRSKTASQKLVDFGYENVIEIGGILDYFGPIE